MNILPEGSPAPAFQTAGIRGEPLDLAALLGAGPAVLCFSAPQVNAGRLVVGYLRRLSENLPDTGVLVVLQGETAAVRHYAGGYLDGLHVVHDDALELSRLYGVTHVPSTLYLAQDGTVGLSFTGFSRPAMNKLAQLAAEATGAKPKELITALDNKGEYELAEKGL